jgi:D-alanyl-D-alanine carboxypeptidase/D-alanyl-D-alanine-endopeptidase (penicillin-binding protein 4)
MMNPFGKAGSLMFFFISGLSLIGSLAFASPQSALESKLKSMSSNGAKVSSQIINLQTGEKVFQFDANTPLNPASSIKLFTAYTALRKLGTAYTFKTEVTEKSDQSICVRGGGDPSFVMEDLYLLVERLKRKGITSYSGSITLDASVFDHEYYPEDRSDQDSERAYNAPIAGLNFNYNTISVFVNPTVKGLPAIVGLDYPFDFVQVNGRVMTGSGTDVTWDKKGKGDLEIVSLGGKIAEGADEWRKPFRIRNPIMAFGEALSRQLKLAGILATGKINVKTGSCTPVSAFSGVSYESKPLSFVIELMDKYSNNFIADSLIKAIDHEVNHKQGTAHGGVAIVRDEMKTLGIDLSSKGRNFVSGSGLSNDNRVSASDFTNLFRQVYREKLYLPELFTSLPIASLDGTLKRKYANTPAAFRLRGKTGTLDNVHSLVGVYPNEKGEWFAVAMIVNGAKEIPEKELGTFLGSL